VVVGEHLEEEMGTEHGKAEVGVEEDWVIAEVVAATEAGVEEEAMRSKGHRGKEWPI